ncbi:MAG: phosphatase PAP2 family protein, partial [Acidimicrobiaceae bacterium]|nr:phosphatase PAP2 family protein [Acidimicrobiaceae bacterium]
MHIFDEERIQSWFIHHVTFMRFWDDYYGTVHFAAVVTVLVVLFFRFPANYRLWRNTLAIATALALIGFAWFPLLPPRLLPSSYGFIDSLRIIGGFWDFQSGPVNSVSNQFAAMPSLHTAWSLWCAIALVGVVRPWWGKVLLFLYPCATVFCIVITANHYFSDALGGIVVLAAGYGGSQLLTRYTERWSQRWREWWLANRPRASQALRRGR